MTDEVMTPELAAVLATDVPIGATVKDLAREAGSGKSTALRKYPDARAFGQQPTLC